MSRLQRGISGTTQNGGTGGGPSRLGGVSQNGAPGQSNKSFEELKRLIHGKLVDKLDLSRVSDLAGDTLRREIRLVVERLCDTENPLLNRMERERLIDEVLDETFGFGPLEVLLKDPTISDILVNGPVKIYVERRGKLEKTDVKFRDNDHLMQIIDRIVSKVGRRVDETSPMVHARLPDGSRVNAIISPLALDGASMSIRRFGANPLKLEDLLNYKAFTPEMAMLMEAAIKARLNILISGGTGCGKTTLLNKAMRQQISSAVDIIIQANRLQGGPRKVTSITEVMGMEQEMIIMQDIFRFRQLGIDQNSRAHGQFEATGVRPSFMPRLEGS